MSETRTVLLLLSTLSLASTACEGSDTSDDTGSETASMNESTGTTAGDETGTVPPPCESTAYSATVDGIPIAVERVCKFDVPVNYIHFTHTGVPAQVAITSLIGPLTDSSLSPLSKNIPATIAGNALSFTANEPGYFILQTPGQERFFVLMDPPEVDAPQVGQPNVLSIMDVPGVDNTGATDTTAAVQGAIDAASGAAQNILYFPPGLYTTKALYLRSNVTLYLAQGAVLQNITTTAGLLARPPELANIEGSPLGYIVMDSVTGAKVIGRGTIDGNGVDIQAANKKMFLVKIEDSSDCVVEGVISRDSGFWNTMVYRSANIHISNYKVINNRLDDEWNETDGVDFNNCTNSSLTNAFLYTGDDCMAVKSDDIQDGLEVSGLNDPTTGPYISVDNIAHEKIVCFSGSSGCKVGTKTFGESMSNISFRDVDLVSVNRGLVIDAVDTALISDTVFEDIRIENVTGRIVDFNMDAESITWRVSFGTASVLGASITNVSSANDAECRIHGNLHDWNPEDPYYGNEYLIDGVTFSNFSVGGNVITSVDDPNVRFNVNEHTANITFSP